VKSIFLFILLSIFSKVIIAEELKSGVFDPPRAAPDFSLSASTGQTFTLSQHKNKIIILGFGFTHCPQICPTTLAKLARVYKQLEHPTDVQVVYITVDPERDSVERLSEYMNYFNSQFIGLTGDPDLLEKLRKDYGIIAAKKIHNNGNYDVHHSSYLYLIDRQGLLRALVPYGKSEEEIVHDVRILLKEKNPS
jgi:protein SCO1/2